MLVIIQSALADHKRLCYPVLV